MKIVLTVQTQYIQEGFKCLILAEGAQKVGEFSCYFSNPPAQRLTTLVSHSEAKLNERRAGLSSPKAPTVLFQRRADVERERKMDLRRRLRDKPSHISRKQTIHNVSGGAGLFT